MLAKLDYNHHFSGGCPTPTAVRLLSIEPDRPAELMTEVMTELMTDVSVDYCQFRSSCAQPSLVSFKVMVWNLN
jgi:hypothetical protein